MLSKWMFELLNQIILSFIAERFKSSRNLTIAKWVL